MSSMENKKGNLLGLGCRRLDSSWVPIAMQALVLSLGDQVAPVKNWALPPSICILLVGILDSNSRRLALVVMPGGV